MQSTPGSDQHHHHHDDVAVTTASNIVSIVAPPPSNATWYHIAVRKKIYAKIYLVFFPIAKNKLFLVFLKSVFFFHQQLKSETHLINLFCFFFLFGKGKHCFFLTPKIHIWRWIFSFSHFSFVHLLVFCSPSPLLLFAVFSQFCSAERPLDFLFEFCPKIKGKCLKFR